jgi:serine/threonine protein kinase
MVFVLTAPVPILLGTVFAITLFMLSDVLRDLHRLPQAAHFHYLKAYGKTVSGQRIILITSTLTLIALFRDCFYRAVLWLPGMAVWLNPEAFEVTWVILPPFVYACFFGIATALTRILLKTKVGHERYFFPFPDIPGASDLPGLTCWARPERSGSTRLIRVEGISGEQLVAAHCYALFMAAFVLTVFDVVYARHGVVTWVAQWLLNSASDANLPGMDNLYRANIAFFAGQKFAHFVSPAQLFIRDMQGASFFVLCLFFWGRASALAVFLTSFVRRLAPRITQDSIAESYVETMRAPTEELVFREGKAWFSNLSQSFLWLLACYVFLLWFFGISEGILGNLTRNMIIDNYFRAGFKSIPSMDIPRLRLFLGAIYALYGTVPLAVMSSVFIPLRKARRFTLTDEGMVVPRGYLVAMHFVPYRVWSDFKSLHLKEIRLGGTKQATSLLKNTLIIKFHGGGSLRLPLAKLSIKDCDRLLGAIDEKADRCHISAEVSALRRQLQPLLKSEFGSAEGEFRALKNEEFTATIFVPLMPGDILPVSPEEYDQGDPNWLDKTSEAEAIDQSIRIVRLLSTKPLCAVYLARLPEGNLAVVKQFFLAGEGPEVESLRKVFKREHELLSELHNPHIARVLHVFEQKESSFIVLQHWQGDDLRSLVRARGPLPPSVVVNYAEQLCRLMHYLHSRPQPVLHRDLSPDNVISDKTGKIKLIDFGAAKQFIACVTGTLIGKQSYMAPEQIRGEASTTSDIYGFGCILHYLLTGLDPRALSPSSPALHVKVPSWLDRLVLACTAFEESERPASFFALTEFFERLPLTDAGAVDALLDEFLPSKDEKLPAREKTEMEVPVMPPLTVSLLPQFAVGSENNVSPQFEEGTVQASSQTSEDISSQLEGDFCPAQLEGDFCPEKLEEDLCPEKLEEDLCFEQLEEEPTSAAASSEKQASNVISITKPRPVIIKAGRRKKGRSHD